MKLLLLFSVLLMSTSTYAYDVLCKSTLLEPENVLLYTNQDLDQVKGDEYFEDCEKLFIPILTNESLPVIDGKRTPVRFSYTLRKDDLFPMIDRMLANYPRQTTKIEIHFWLDDLGLKRGSDLTDIRVELMPKE